MRGTGASSAIVISNSSVVTDLGSVSSTSVFILLMSAEISEVGEVSLRDTRVDAETRAAVFSVIGALVFEWTLTGVVGARITRISVLRAAVVARRTRCLGTVTSIVTVARSTNIASIEVRSSSFFAEYLSAAMGTVALLTVRGDITGVGELRVEDTSAVASLAASTLLNEFATSVVAFASRVNFTLASDLVTASSAARDVALVAVRNCSVTSNGTANLQSVSPLSASIVGFADTVTGLGGVVVEDSRVVAQFSGALVGTACVAVDFREPATTVGSVAVRGVSLDCGAMTSLVPRATAAAIVAFSAAGAATASTTSVASVEVADVTAVFGMALGDAGGASPRWRCARRARPARAR